MRNVIVTGATRGLGLATALKLAAGGYRVLATGRTESDPLREAAGQSPNSLHFLAHDLNNAEGIADLVKSARERFGPVYGLVNNAGISFEGVLPLMRDSEIEQLLRINILAPILLTKNVVKSMIAEGGGRIVNVASITAFAGCSGLSVYSATKAAMIGFTRSLAREVGRTGVTVNAVAPGFIETGMTGSMNEEQRERIMRRSALRRLAEPCDVAGSVEFLLSEGARNITGTVITVDAGSTA